MTQIFRQAALDRLSSPEHLDRALVVATSKVWLALVALVVMAAATVVWSLEGEVATYVQANGILLSHGGAVVDAVPSSPGDADRHLPRYRRGGGEREGRRRGHQRGNDGAPP